MTLKHMRNELPVSSANMKSLRILTPANTTNPKASIHLKGLSYKLCCEVVSRCNLGAWRRFETRGCLALWACSIVLIGQNIAHGPDFLHFCLVKMRPKRMLCTNAPLVCIRLKCCF